jgi:hypothetical protein
MNQEWDRRSYLNQTATAIHVVEGRPRTGCARHSQTRNIWVMLGCLLSQLPPISSLSLIDASLLIRRSLALQRPKVA